MAIWKFLHVLGAVLMLGNVIVTGLWAHWGLQARDGRVDAFITRAILKADLYLTLLGGTLLVIAGGFLAAPLGGAVLHTPWLVHGMGALAVATVVWLVALLPDQVRMDRLALAPEPAALRRVYWRWSVLGWADTAILLYALWAMVAKA